MAAMVAFVSDDRAFIALWSHVRYFIVECVLVVCLSLPLSSTLARAIFCKIVFFSTTSIETTIDFKVRVVRKRFSVPSGPRKARYTRDVLSCWRLMLPAERAATGKRTALHTSVRVNEQ